MSKFAVLRNIALVSMMIATQAQAHVIRGREVAAPSFGAMCVSDHGSVVCGEPLWFYGARAGHAGKSNPVQPDADAPHWIGD